jgi:mono/diheme cytochrome c family protein
MSRIPIVLLFLLAACARRSFTPQPEAKTLGAALVEVSGGRQAAGIGMAVDQPLVVQVNDAQGSPVAGAPVWFHAAGGAVLNPATGLTGSDGQFSATLTLGGSAGRYQVVARSRDTSGKEFEIRLDEIALGYQQMQGRQLNEQHCVRCHESESSAERVSNHDNLTKAPHSFSEGGVLNAMSDADLESIISHGGPALNRSPEMPPYGYTLGKPEIEAVMAYIRAVSDPPYRPKGLIYASR